MTGSTSVYRFDTLSGDYLGYLKPPRTGDEPAFFIEGGMVVKGDRLLVAEGNAAAILAFDAATAEAQGVFATGETNTVLMDIALGPGGDVFLLELALGVVRRFDGVTGAFEKVFASTGPNFATCLAFGPDGHLYVGNGQDDSVRKFNGQTGQLIGEFVRKRSGGLRDPEDLAFGPDGHLYVVSYGTNQELKYHGTTGAFMSVFIGSGLDRPSGLLFIDHPFPAEPGEFRAEQEGDDLVLSWRDRADNESGYLVQERNSVTGVWADLATLPPGSEELVLPDLVADVPHTFRVRSLSAGGNSAWAPEASATVAKAGCDAVAHCLVGGRFAVHVNFVASFTPERVGKPLDLLPGDDAGVFWFFYQSIPEIAVKVLDGRVFNDHFWTFYGALSNVEYWVVVVRDLVTGESRTYHNPPDNITGRADTTSLPAAASAEPLAIPAATACKASTPRTATATPGSCMTSATQACLYNRFLVEVGYNSPAGSGTATASQASFSVALFSSSTQRTLSS